MTENHLEDFCFDWLAELGYECLLGDEVSPNGAEEDRARYSDVVLASRLQSALKRFNPTASATELSEAFNKIAGYASQSLVDGNKELYDWLRNGVPVERTDDDGHRTVSLLTVIDTKGQNDFIALRQFTVHGQKVRRPDIVLMVNGLPLVVIELKNPADLNADIESAYNQIETYKSDISQLFYYNLLNIISDGTVARYGSLTADFGRFTPWRLLDGKKQTGKTNVQMELEIMVRGLLSPATLIHFFHKFDS
ncbi:MAG: type I restriction endonuclease subunit R, partial [Thiotrichales bacterium]|nr:type I restriction endonuclease subunit R [Thiotrichales bacterium]